MAVAAGKRLRVGVSACLLGQEVRWDGGHKREEWLVEVLGAHVEWVPVCPELEVGLGVPREPIRLVGDPRAPRLVSTSGVDLTRRMQSWVEKRGRELAALDLSGYVLKKNSPSCGIARVRVHPSRGGRARRAGVGIFARGLRRRFPLLPIEEEGGLRDPILRDTFVEQIHGYARWREALAAGMTPSALARFHARHELVLLAHSPAAHRRLGALAASVRSGAFQRTVGAYGRGFMEALRSPATRARHVKVLRQVLEHWGGSLRPGGRAEFESAIREYRAGHAPLSVPLSLAREHARKLGEGWLSAQLYLSSGTGELLLHPDP